MTKKYVILTTKKCMPRFGSQIQECLNLVCAKASEVFTTNTSSYSIVPIVNEASTACELVYNPVELDNDYKTLRYLPLVIPNGCNKITFALFVETNDCGEDFPVNLLKNINKMLHSAIVELHNHCPDDQKDIVNMIDGILEDRRCIINWEFIAELNSVTYIPKTQTRTEMKLAHLMGAYITDITIVKIAVGKGYARIVKGASIDDSDIQETLAKRGVEIKTQYSMSDEIIIY